MPNKNDEETSVEALALAIKAFKERSQVNICDWHTHTPTTIYVRGLPIIFESNCKHCGRPIVQDSQGNWVSYPVDNDEIER